jgi:hypothetical protein
VCELFGPILRQAIDDLVRRGGVHFPAEVWQEVEAMEIAGRASRQQRTTLAPRLVTTRPAALAPARVDVVHEVTVSEAARITGRTRQAVQQRISSGSLPARRDEHGHWRIRCENLAPAAV